MAKHPLIRAVEHLSMAALHKSPRNARRHSKPQVCLIARSIERFGFNNPILIDRDNVIVAGHGRYEAAQLLGLETVPTLRLEHLSPDEIRAYVLADNKLAERAGWDKEILAIELEYLTSLDIDLDVTVTGFEIGEIDVILGQATDDGEEEPIKETKGPAVTRPGDLWLLDKHRVLCADALEQRSFNLLLRGKPAEIVFTDPPYNVPISGNVSRPGRHREFAMATGEMTEAEFERFLSKIFERLSANSAGGSVHYICMDWRHVREACEAGKIAFRQLLNICVWVKDNGGMGSLYRSRHEFVLVFKNGRARHRNNVELGKFGRNRTNVWNYPGANTFGRRGEEGDLTAIHPTVKPVALIIDALLDCSARGDVVLDPFLGSGSTLIAAERAKRICRGIEIDPLYVDATVRRWQRHTGGAAVLEATGETFGQREMLREAING